MNNRLIALLALITLSFAGYAQSGKLAKADRLFETYAYAEATELYEEYLEKHEHKEATARLAECYRLTNQFEKAEHWFGRLMTYPDVDPIYTLYYGKMLQTNGKCEEANKYFDEYSSQVPNDRRGRKLAESCEKINEFYTTEDRYEIKEFKHNSSNTDMGPAFAENGIVFSSSRVDRGRVHGWTGEPFLDLYRCERKNGEYMEPKAMSSQLNSEYHEGPMALREGDKVIYFTRNTDMGDVKKENKMKTVRLVIMGAQRKLNGSWSRPEELPFNDQAYSTAHPTIDKAGTVMVFSSDMEGGFGGSDLYVTTKKGGNWGKPINLGPDINTEGEEVFPFIHEDGTLYFTSDGHPGLGGLDIFTAKLKTEEAPNLIEKVADGWRTAENMGYPLNTKWDDFGLIWDEKRKEAFFTSNRDNGTGGDDLYHMRSLYFKLNVVVFDSKTGSELEGAEVTYRIPDRELTGYTDANGIYTFDIKKDVTMELTASYDGYYPNQQRYEYQLSGEEETLRIPLEKLPEPVVTLKTKVIDRETKEPIADAVVLVEPNCQTDPIETSTNGLGIASKEIPDMCGFNMTVQSRGYLDGFDYFTSPRLGRNSETVERVIELQPLEVGVVIELKNIYYDYNKYSIRSDAEPDLQRVIALLKSNPGMRIELGSHTDARGSDSYNQKLSQNRAQAAVDYITRYGISSDRVVAKGYGEYRVRNRCKNGVNCTKDEHQYNRRTEFRVTGIDKTIQSSDHNDIKVGE